VPDGIIEVEHDPSGISPQHRELSAWKELALKDDDIGGAEFAKERHARKQSTWQRAEFERVAGGFKVRAK